MQTHPDHADEDAAFASTFSTAVARMNSERRDPTAGVHTAYLVDLYHSPRYRLVPASLRAEQLLRLITHYRRIVETAWPLGVVALAGRPVGVLSLVNAGRRRPRAVCRSRRAHGRRRELRTSEDLTFTNRTRTDL